MAKMKVLPSGGLAVKVVGDAQTKRQLASMPVLVQRKVMRLAIAAGARPVAIAARQALRGISSASKRREGIGASERSISIKTASKKSDPNVAYAVVGARRGYSEVATIRAGTTKGRAGAVKSITSYRVTKRGRRGRFAVNTKDIKKFTPAARRARLRPQKGRDDKHRRVPSKYLHLLEKGRHKTPPHWPGWNFMSRIANSLAPQVHQIMKDHIAKGVQREWLKFRRAG